MFNHDKVGVIFGGLTSLGVIAFGCWIVVKLMQHFGII